MIVLIILGALALLFLAGESPKQAYLRQMPDEVLYMNDQGARMEGKYPNMYSIEIDRREAQTRKQTA